MTEKESVEKSLSENQTIRIICWEIEQLLFELKNRMNSAICTFLFLTLPCSINSQRSPKTKR